MTTTDEPTDANPDDDPIEETTPESAVLVLETGEIVIYDSDNHRAWIQSDDAIVLSEAV